jgi:hypothetical protein
MLRCRNGNNLASASDGVYASAAPAGSQQVAHCPRTGSKAFS